MKVRVSYTVEVDDDYRRAINLHYGKEGLATRDDVRQWLKEYGESCDADIMNELDESGTQRDGEQRG